MTGLDTICALGSCRANDGSGVRRAMVNGGGTEGKQRGGHRGGNNTGACQ
jgi:hypothetical protein